MTMPPNKQTDSAESSLPPRLLKELETVLGKLQERIALERSPGQQFAFIRLVEGMSLAQWRELCKSCNLSGWLALPIDKQDGVPLQTLRKTLEELVHQRDHDMLTGLANRRFFDKQVTLEMERALRSRTPLSLAMIDLDHFKAVNDAHGHATGDKVLVALSDLLVRSLRPYDVAARIGGEEFCLILPGADARQAADLVSRMLEEFRGIVFETPDGRSFSVTFSAGVAANSGSRTETAGQVLAHADELLYTAKHQGRNQIVTTATKQKVSDNPALVLVAEKQFLFTGKTKS